MESVSITHSFVIFKPKDIIYTVPWILILLLANYRGVIHYHISYGETYFSVDFLLGNFYNLKWIILKTWWNTFLRFNHIYASGKLYFHLLWYRCDIYCCIIIHVHFKHGIYMYISISCTPFFLEVACQLPPVSSFQIYFWYIIYFFFCVCVILLHYIVELPLCCKWTLSFLSQIKLWRQTHGLQRLL